MKTFSFTNKSATWLYIAASLVAGASLAWDSGPLHILWAVPAYFCFLGLDAFSRQLPERMKPLAPVIAILAVILIGFSSIYFLAKAAGEAPDVSFTRCGDGSAQARAKCVDAPAAQAPADDAAIAQSQAQMIEALEQSPDAEAGVRIFSLFVAELNARSVENPDMDQMTWLQAMQSCVDAQDQKAITPERMGLIAQCADKKLTAITARQPL